MDGEITIDCRFGLPRENSKILASCGKAPIFSTGLATDFSPPAALLAIRAPTGSIRMPSPRTNI